MDNFNILRPNLGMSKGSLQKRIHQDVQTSVGNLKWVDHF